MAKSPRHALLSLALVLACLSQLAGPHAAQAARPSAPARAAVAPRDAARIQAGLNALIVRGLTLAGLKTTAVTSDLGALSAAPVESDFNSTGRWTVTATDEQETVVTLTASLAYSLTGVVTPQETRGSTALSGEFAGPGLTIAVDFSQSLDKRGGDAGFDTRSTYSTITTRGGVSQAARLSLDAQISTPAHDFVQNNSQTVLVRDGNAIRLDQRATIHTFGKGEAEVWIDAGLTAPESLGAAGPITASQHAFVRSADGAINQYVDRFSAQVFTETYTLRTPGSSTLSAGGVALSGLQLADSHGGILGVTTAKGIDGLFSPAGLTMVSSGQGSPQASACEAAVGFLLGVIASALIAAAAISFLPELAVGAVLSEALIELIIGNIVTTLIGLIAEQAKKKDPKRAADIEALSGVLQLLAGFMFGINLLNGAGAVANGVSYFFGGPIATALCNGDPYFVTPDGRGVSRKRPNASTVAHITRISGGIYSPDSINTAARQPGAVTASDRAAWVNGAPPAGAKIIGDWTWDNARPFGPAPSHLSDSTNGVGKHYFLHATGAISLSSDDSLIQYVYLDPAKPPKQIYLQFYTGDGDGEHRAYWGEPIAQTGGTAGTSALYPMGPLPKTGGWLRLKVPAGTVGLTGSAINGVLYGTVEGRAWWGPTTSSRSSTDSSPDAAAVATPDAALVPEPGAQVAYELSKPAQVAIDIVDADGALIRTLDAPSGDTPGFKVASWDAKNTNGDTVADARYTAQIKVSGNVVATSTVTISPLVARIAGPRAFSLVRGSDVPIMGEAYGTRFEHYVLDYGAGLTPTAWTEIANHPAPVVLPDQPVQGVHSGNLSNWDTGVNEFTPWSKSGLNGVYTLRLRAFGADGRVASDQLPVVVGRLAHSAEGGVVSSPDGSASIAIPAMATENGFALSALVPSGEVDPGEAWRATIPAGLQPAGSSYESLTGDEVFRRGLTVTIPVDSSAANAAAIVVGDGTTGGWRTLGGTLDATGKALLVNTTALTGTRVILGAFTGASPVEPAITDPIAGEQTFDAPLVRSSSHPAAFYDDFASGAGEWIALDTAGTTLSVAQGAEAGLTGQARAIKVTRQPGGVRLVQARHTPYDARDFPLLSFDYRVAGDGAPNILVHSDGHWYQFSTGSTAMALTKYYSTLSAPGMIADGAWHHYQLDLLASLRESGSPTATLQIDQIVLGQFESARYMQAKPVDAGNAGDAYWIGAFSALRPSKLGEVAASVAPADPSAQPYAGISVALDQNAGTIPPERAAPGVNDTTVTLPVGPSEGLWYVHARGQTSDGRWTSTAHFPVLADRIPPALGKPSPSPNGAGSMADITIPVANENGIDPLSAKVTLNGVLVPTGRAVQYSPALGAVEVQPLAAQPPMPVSFVAGTPVSVSLTELLDYAGNALAGPLSWEFTIDEPKVTGLGLYSLTVKGGSAPALSPDGSTLAFVSSRAGEPRIWMMRADDYGEQGNSAHLFTGDVTGTSESAPAWSVDGAQLAWVSEANGRAALWTGNAVGGGAKPLGTLSGRLASPTWSPDGAQLAVIKDGNLWLVDTRSGSAQPATRILDGPYRQARWQPNGSLIALQFGLYEERIELFDVATGQIRQITRGGHERDPAWLNGVTPIYAGQARDNAPFSLQQTNVDGTLQQALEDAPPAGANEDQPAAAADGGTIAFVSTRGGSRQIWVRTALQLAQFEVMPGLGAPSGEAQEIHFTLPIAAQVTLRVMKLDKPVRVLLDKSALEKGPQTVSWDGADANGAKMAPGDYAVELTAEVSGNRVQRTMSAHVLDGRELGQLQVNVLRWKDAPAPNDSVSIKVYPAGQRTGVVVNAANVDEGFKLPAGRYDVLATLSGGAGVGQGYEKVVGIARGVTVLAGGGQIVPIDLGLGGLSMQVFSAKDQVVVDSTVQIEVRSMVDGDSTIIAYAKNGLAEFSVRPGDYAVTVSYAGLSQQRTQVRVDGGRSATIAVNFSSSQLNVPVLAWADIPANPTWLVVEAYPAGQRGKPVATSLYQNPGHLRLPAGTYDIRITNNVSSERASIGGDNTAWLNGVTLAAGETLTQEVNMHLGEAALTIFDSQGVPADPKQLTFAIYPAGGDQTKKAAEGLFRNDGIVQLPPGDYEVKVNRYNSSDDIDDKRVAGAFHVDEGKRVDAPINLMLGGLRLTVAGADGAPLPKDAIRAIRVYPAGRTESPLPLYYLDNPFLFGGRADRAYDFTIELESGVIRLKDQRVTEGQLREVTVNAVDANKEP